MHLPGTCREYFQVELRAADGLCLLGNPISNCPLPLSALSGLMEETFRSTPEILEEPSSSGPNVDASDRDPNLNGYTGPSRPPISQTDSVEPQGKMESTDKEP